MKSSLLSAAKSLATGNRFRARASLAAASAVIAAGTALTPSVSQAVIIWSGNVDLVSTGSPIQIDPSSLTGIPGLVAGSVFFDSKGSAARYSFFPSSGSDLRTSDPIPSGTEIPGTVEFSSNQTFTLPNTAPDSRNIVPLRSDLDGVFRFGWLEYSTTSNSVTVHQWALNSTPNEQILAGAIPEPAHAALLTAATALVAVGLIRRRKRQQA
jgi:hypothetical protein